MIDIESTVVKTVDYLYEKGELIIRLQNGTLYRYFNVEPDCVCEFLFAQSKGAFFANEIKPHYDCERIE